MNSSYLAHGKSAAADFDPVNYRYVTSGYNYDCGDEFADYVDAMLPDYTEDDQKRQSRCLKPRRRQGISSWRPWTTATSRTSNTQILFMALDNERRKELLDRLEALLNMTVANGCSEHEAEVAAKKATKLMEEYGLTLEQVQQARPDTIAVGQVFTGSTKIHPVFRCAFWIAELTHTDCFGTSRIYDPQARRFKDSLNEQQAITFLGFPADVEVAKFLVQLFKTAMEVSWAKHWKSVRDESPEHPATARTSFMAGMVRRLNDRMKVMVGEREVKNQASNECREIIRLTGALIQQRLDELNIRLKKQRPRRIRLNAHYKAGVQAGDHVSISAGFVDNKQTKNLN